MKNVVFWMVLFTVFAALAPMANAASDAEVACKKACCEASGGEWDEYFESCDTPSSSYYTCINYCGDNTMAKNTPCCCGSAFILSIVGGALFLVKKQS